jgi:hypothetical protein
MAKKSKPASAADQIAAFKDHAKALREHSKAMNAFARAITTPGSDGASVLENHTKALNSLVAAAPMIVSGNVISKTTIRNRLAHKWGKPESSVKDADPIGKYVKGGPGVMSAYWAVLNQYPEFAHDHLNLQTADTAFATTVGELIANIGDWYKSQGWQVTN